MGRWASVGHSDLGARQAAAVRRSMDRAEARAAKGPEHLRRPDKSALLQRIASASSRHATAFESAFGGTAPAFLVRPLRIEMRGTE